jgi:cell filamentation protein
MPGLADGETLKNKLGASTHEDLERLEAPFVAARYIEITLGFGPQGQFDTEHLKTIHKHLFQSVYEWAGHTRDERVRLPDGAVATEPVLRKDGGSEFHSGRAISLALDQLTTDLRKADYLRGLTREQFAERAADTMAELNAIHPFREGNGRTQRVFIEELAKAAGHPLDFTVVSRERMIQASIDANEKQDPKTMRRIFAEISDPARVGALREVIDFFDKQEPPFPWNDRYIATTEPGYKVTLTMAGIAGEHFLARTSSEILVGRVSDLPAAEPKRGETFAIVPTAENVKESRQHQTERQQREESDKRQTPAVDPVSRTAREVNEAAHPLTADERATTASHKRRFTPGEDRPSDERSQTRGEDRVGRGGRTR